jgi:hypothetical protein
MSGNARPPGAVPQRLLPWARSDIYAVAALLLFWLFKASRILTDITHRHFAMRLSIPDVLEQQWNTYWLGRVVTGLAESVHYCPLMNYPAGADYFGARPNYIHCLVAGWFHMKWDGVPAANTVALAAILFSMVAFYVLFRQLARSRAIGFAVTLLVASFSLMFDNQLLDISLCNAGFLALALHFWLRAVDNPNWRPAVLSVLFALLTGISHLYYGAMLFGFVGLALPFLAFAEFRGGTGPSRSTLYSFAILSASMIFVAVALWGPLATIRAVSAEGGVAPQLAARRLGRPELLMTCLAIAAVVGGAWALRKHKVPGAVYWVTCTVFLFLMSLGDRSFSPVVGHEGVPQDGLLLSWLLRIIPFGWRFTQPDRLTIGTLIGAGGLAAVLWRGFSAVRLPSPQLNSLAGKRALFIVTIVLVIPMLGVSTPYRAPGALYQLTTSGGRRVTGLRDDTLAYLPCSSGAGKESVSLAGEPTIERYLWPLLPLEYTLFPGVPKVLADLADDPEPMAIMEVGGDVHFLSLYYQTVHGKGVGGYHLPQHLWSAHPPSPLTLAEEEIRKDRNYDSLSLARLREMGVRYIIRHVGDNPKPGPLWCPEKALVAEALEALSAPHLKLVHEDSVVQVWQVDSEVESP